MIQAFIAGALAGAALVGVSITAARISEDEPKDIYTFGNPAAIIETMESVTDGE